MTDSALLRRSRRWATCVAVVLVALGGLFVAAGVDASQYDSAVGGGLVLGVVTVAFSTGTLVWSLRRLPAVEERARVGRSARREEMTQGATFDRLAGWRVLPPVVPATDRDRIRNRLRAAAVEAVAGSAACDYETARRQVRRGDWTADAVAGAFLGGCPPPRRVVWAARVSQSVAFAVGARATLAAIDRQTDEERT
ncbi:DUF7269 family protein [Halobacterium jilantaiense]|nr:hypothetical protein [Halobacterium jilantaiense]